MSSIMSSNRSIVLTSSQFPADASYGTAADPPAQVGQDEVLPLPWGSTQKAAEASPPFLVLTSTSAREPAIVSGDWEMNRSFQGERQRSLKERML